MSGFDLFNPPTLAPLWRPGLDGSENEQPPLNPTTQQDASTELASRPSWARTPLVRRLLDALAVLEAQQSAVVADIARLESLKSAALDDPEALLSALRHNRGSLPEEWSIPPRVEPADLPEGLAVLRRDVAAAKNVPGFGSALNAATASVVGSGVKRTRAEGGLGDPAEDEEERMRAEEAKRARSFAPAWTTYSGPLRALFNPELPTAEESPPIRWNPTPAYTGFLAHAPITGQNINLLGGPLVVGSAPPPAPPPAATSPSAPTNTTTTTNMPPPTQAPLTPKEPALSVAGPSEAQEDVSAALARVQAELAEEERQKAAERSKKQTVEVKPEPAPVPTLTGDAIVQVVRGRVVKPSDPKTFNMVWTDQEQELLELLMKKYPAQKPATLRWKKIAEHMPTRTPKQIASRVQKMQERGARRRKITTVSSLDAKVNAPKLVRLGEMTGGEAVTDLKRIHGRASEVKELAMDVPIEARTTQEKRKVVKAERFDPGAASTPTHSRVHRPLYTVAPGTMSLFQVWNKNIKQHKAARASLYRTSDATGMQPVVDDDFVDADDWTAALAASNDAIGNGESQSGNSSEDATLLAELLAGDGMTVADMQELLKEAEASGAPELAELRALAAEQRSRAAQSSMGTSSSTITTTTTANSSSSSSSSSSVSRPRCRSCGLVFTGGPVYHCQVCSDDPVDLCPSCYGAGTFFTATHRQDHRFEKR